MANTDIKGVIFDYGGTIDSRGVHWSEIIWDGYKKAQVPVDKQQFRDCYVFAERELAKTRHILPEHNFLDLLRIKMNIELQKTSSTTTCCRRPAPSSKKLRKSPNTAIRQLKNPSKKPARHLNLSTTECRWCL